MKKIQKFTQLESAFIESFISRLYAEEGFSDVDINDISEDLNESQKVLRGVLSSLVKKGVCHVETNSSGFDIIYLDSDYYYLHPEWGKEDQELKSNLTIMKKIIPGFARYEMDSEGRVFSTQNQKEMSVTQRVVDGVEMPFVRLTSDEGKRVFIDKEKVYIDLFQQDITGATKEEGKKEDIKKQPRQLLVTPQIAADIRKKKAQGVRNKDLAKEYGIHQSTVSNIVNNRKYVYNK